MRDRERPGRPRDILVRYRALGGGYIRRYGNDGGGVGGAEIWTDVDRSE